MSSVQRLFTIHFFGVFLFYGGERVGCSSCDSSVDKRGACLVTTMRDCCDNDDNVGYP